MVNMRHLSVRQLIAGDPVRVMEAIWSGAEWNARWDAIKQFDVRYDDGLHQIADITLDWFDTCVHMEVVRFRIRPLCIEFFCPRPPRPLSHQSGRWFVEHEDKRHFVVAFRQIALTEGPMETQSELEQRLSNYAARLSTRLVLILARFACALE
jgi:hypothetical protein